MENGDDKTTPEALPEGVETGETTPEAAPAVQATLPPSSGTTMADTAIEAATRLEAANEVTSKNLDRQEALMARQALGGRTMQAVTPKKKTQDELDEEEAKNFMSED